MKSNRPYLIRALYEWILDNEMTPHILVDAEIQGVSVPGQFVDDGRIILNVSPVAVHDLELGNEWILFSARFSGAMFHIQLPVRAVLAIYAKENGRGMVFPDEDVQFQPEAERPHKDEKKPARPSLKVIK